MGIECPKESTNPAISVVIATVPYSDHGQVCRLLKEQNTDQEYEIIVVNDPSVDRCVARNAGIKKAIGEIVAVTDDDTKPPQNWLSAIWSEFDSEKNLVCLEGKVSDGINYDGVRKYVGCNMAFRRESVLQVSGYDSRYAGWREDTELGWRMERDADGICKYSDEVYMRHPPMPRTEFDPRREQMLRTEYPNRYDAIMNDCLLTRGYRVAQRIGAVSVVNRIRDSLQIRE